jgi:hypothetical protein
MRFGQKLLQLQMGAINVIIHYLGDTDRWSLEVRLTLTSNIVSYQKL